MERGFGAASIGVGMGTAAGEEGREARPAELLHSPCVWGGFLRHSRTVKSC